MSSSSADIFDDDGADDDDADGEGNASPAGKAAENPAVAARRAAMNWLGRREHSCHELLQKLIARFPDVSRDDVLLPALLQLQDDNLQSDARFAEAFVRYRSTRGCGPLKIAAQLYSRKLDSELLKEVLYDKGPDWETICTETLHRKFKVSASASLGERQRWQRFLQQRGFSHAHIRAALKSLYILSDEAKHPDDDLR